MRVARGAPGLCSPGRQRLSPGHRWPCCTHSRRTCTGGSPGTCRSRPGRWAGRWVRVGSENGVEAKMRHSGVSRAKARARSRFCGRDARTRTSQSRWSSWSSHRDRHQAHGWAHAERRGGEGGETRRQEPWRGSPGPSWRRRSSCRWFALSGVRAALSRRAVEVPRWTRPPTTRPSPGRCITGGDAHVEAGRRLSEASGAAPCCLLRPGQSRHCLPTATPRCGAPTTTPPPASCACALRPCMSRRTLPSPAPLTQVVCAARVLARRLPALLCAAAAAPGAGYPPRCASVLLPGSRGTACRGFSQRSRQATSRE